LKKIRSIHKRRNPLEQRKWEGEGEKVEINRKDGMSVREWVASSWSEIERKHRRTRGDYQLRRLLTTCCTNTKEKGAGNKEKGKERKEKERKGKKKHPWEISTTEMPRANANTAPSVREHRKCRARRA
jgi:hypothetical protein